MNNKELQRIQKVIEEMGQFPPPSPFICTDEEMEQLRKEDNIRDYVFGLKNRYVIQQLLPEHMRPHVISDNEEEAEIMAQKIHDMRHRAEVIYVNIPELFEFHWIVVIPINVILPRL